MPFTWITGTDTTEYYINTTNGAVVGMLKDAGNGQQLFKVGFGAGLDFTHQYHTAALAKAAIENLAPATRQLKVGTNAKQLVRKAARATPRKKPR